jgi:RimJ/RimL family protein N-acetyltransferase
MRVDDAGPRAVAMNSAAINAADTALAQARRSGMLALADPGLVRVRRVQARDTSLLADFFNRLSPQSRRRRFHSGVREIPLSWLDRFTHPDADAELALLAVTTHAGAEVCVGEARYAIDDDATQRREFALAIADDWQGLGLGTRLLCAMARHAEDRGVEVLYGDVLRDNLPMLGLAKRLGYRLLRHPSDATLVRVALTLNEEQQFPHSFLCRETVARQAVA